VNLQIHGDRRELEEEPGVSRAITRLLCLLFLLGGFCYAFYWLFMDEPNINVKRYYLEGEDSNFAIERLYNSSASYGTNITEVGSTEQEILDCPCTTTTISWIDYVHFYTINSTFIDPSSGKPIMDYGEYNDQFSLNSLVGTTVLDSVGSRLSTYLSRDRDDLTTEKFCSNLLILPSRFMDGLFQELDCKGMVTALLTTTPTAELTPTQSGVGSMSWNDPRASYFESPSLQNQKYLYSNTIHRLHGKIIHQSVSIVRLQRIYGV